MTLSPVWRRLRGVVSMALLWAAAWFPVGVALIILGVRPTVDAPVFYRWRLIAIQLLLWCTWGVISGGVFAVALAVAERKPSLWDLSMLRTSLWGGLGSASAPAAIMTIAYWQTGPRVPLPYIIVVAATAPLGAMMAAGSLAVARRAPASQPSLSSPVDATPSVP